MSEASSLTILLTLKDRAPFTKRWLSYAAAVAMPYRILIADGSSDDSAAPLAAEARAAGVNVEWVRYPPDRAYADYYAKLADAVSRVTTPLVVLADNDDLFITSGLAQAARFLIDHPSYVACGGQAAMFWMSTNGASQAAEALYGDTLDWKCSSHISTDVADTATERLLGRSLGANDVFYAVHRTALLRRQFEAIRECNPRDLFLMEQLIMFLTAIEGKTRQLDTLYIARQQDSPASSGGSHQQKFGGWYDRMLLPTWSEDFSRFVDCAAAALARADGISDEEARRTVVKCYKLSVAPSLLADLVEEPTVSWSMPMVLQIVRGLVSLPRASVLRRAATACYRRARWLSHDFVHGTEFRTRRASQAAREFTPVRTFLANPARHNSQTSGT